MKVSKIQLIGVFGSLAAFAGASYYFYKRKQAQLSHIERFKKWFQRINVVDPIQMKQNFEFSFYLEVGQFLSDNYAFYDKNYEEQKQRCCGIGIQQGYQCYDCIPQQQFEPNEIEVDQELPYVQFIHTICEDCFDEEAHKGHRYIQLPFEFVAYCCCGLSHMMKEQSFCKNHKGYEDLQTEYTQNFPIQTKEKIINYFNEMISYLIDYTSYQLSKSNQNNQQHILTKFNSLFTMILNQILQLIQENNLVVYSFIDLFQQKVNIPTYIDTQNSQEMAFLKRKKIDHNETTLDYLFRFIPLYNDQSLIQLNQVFKILSNAHEEFSLLLTKKFLKFNQIIFNIYFDEKYYSDSNILFRISYLYSTCLMSLSQSKNRQEICTNYENELLNVIRLNIILFRQFQFREFQNLEWLIILNFNKQLQCILIYPNIFDQFSLKNELLEEILDIFAYFADQFLLGSQDLSVIDDFLQRNDTLYHLFLQQRFLIDNIYFFIYNLFRLQKQQLIIKLRMIISQKIDYEVNRIYDELISFSQINQKNKYHFGLHIIYFVIIIIFLGQRQFNYTGIMDTFKESFSYSSDEEVFSLTKKILFILKYYIPSELIESTESVFFDLVQEVNERQIQNWQEVLDYSHSSQYNKYDAHILTFQIVYLITPKEYNLSYLNIFDLTRNGNNNFLYRYKHTLLINQIFFDQTPLINYISDSVFLIENDESYKQNYKKAIKSTILQLLNNQENSQIQLSTLKQQILFYLGDSKLNDKFLEEIGEVCEIRNTFTKKKSTKQSYHIFNLGRSLSTIENSFNSKINDNKTYMIEHNDFYHDLFDFQKQLIIREFSNYQFFKAVLSLLVSQGNVQIINILNKYFILFFTIINMSKELPQLFIQDQLQVTEQIEKDFYDQNTLKELTHLYEIYLNENKNIVESRKDIQLFYDTINKIYQYKYIQIVES